MTLNLVYLDLGIGLSNILLGLLIFVALHFRPGEKVPLEEMMEKRNSPIPLFGFLGVGLILMGLLTLGLSLDRLAKRSSLAETALHQFNNVEGGFDSLLRYSNHSGVCIGSKCWKARNRYGVLPMFIEKARDSHSTGQLEIETITTSRYQPPFLVQIRILPLQTVTEVPQQ